MIVMKFGGTSVGGVSQIKRVASIVENNKRDNKCKPVIAVSAIAGVTDKLLNLIENALKGDISKLKEIEKLHHDILHGLDLELTLIDDLLYELSTLTKGIALVKECSLRTKDAIASFGERMSSRIVAAYLNKTAPAKSYTGWEIGIVTDNNYTEAEILDETYDNIKQKLESLNHIPVITGFIAKSKEGEITTLGRGGSDYTAAIVGAAIFASEIQIWTDVDGIMTCDPRVVKDAVTIPKISFVEAAELAYFGAKVLHPKTIIPAMIKNIPVRIKNTHNQTHPGTLILKEIPRQQHPFKAIAFRKNVAFIRLSSSRMLNACGFMARIFEVFKEHDVSVDMVTTSEVTVSITVEEDKKSNLEKVLHKLEKYGSVDVKYKRAIICIVGQDMKYHPECCGKIFSIIGNEKVSIELISQGASQVNISIVVKEDYANNLVNLLNEKLICSNDGICK